MRIVKKFYLRDRQSAIVSRAFDKVIVRTGPPKNIDRLEVDIGTERTEINDKNARIGINAYNPILEDDMKLARILVEFELFRLQTRRIFGTLPRFLEDILTGREMVKAGYEDDLCYLHYILFINNPATTEKEIIDLNSSWLSFWKLDGFYYDMFHQFCQERAKPSKKIDEFLKAMKKDMFDEKNLQKVIKLYGDFNTNN